MATFIFKTLVFTSVLLVTLEASEFQDLFQRSSKDKKGVPSPRDDCDNYCSFFHGVVGECINRNVPERRLPQRPTVSQLSELWEQMCGYSDQILGCVAQRSSRCGIEVATRRTLWLSRFIDSICDGDSFNAEFRAVFPKSIIPIVFANYTICPDAQWRPAPPKKACFLHSKFLRNVCGAASEQQGALNFQRVLDDYIDECVVPTMREESGCSEEEIAAVLAAQQFIRVPGNSG